MKKISSWVVVGGLLVILGAGTAEAGVGDWVKNSWSYVTAPVPCLLNLGKALLDDSIQFVTCVWGNINRNPATLERLVP